MLVQLFDDQGIALKAKGATIDEVLSKGLLHGAAHVWIYRSNGNRQQVLLQKRSATKKTYPGLLDVSAAGHIDLGEVPLTAAIREIYEEIGLKVDKDQLKLVTKFYLRKPANNSLVENEYCWIYLYRLDHHVEFKLQASEVASLEWIDLKKFARDLSNDNVSSYVPQGKEYFSVVVNAIRDSQ